ncbi:rhamnosyltransferase [Clostridium folliculivorans]|uniref:Rhamnosyltransferase n=1 Tax=Clostridium folliculivorans TaxID=2886038 RepID=A0A9W5Y663_9CLOT|nr:glycosyltransferase [Clostridium folliculivorans]GKU27274.1 rhamnosyltransferase [Clostridium folliculivorans]
MKVAIICPLYNAEKYIKGLHENLLRQKCNFEVNINYVLTESNDSTKSILDEMKVNYQIVKKGQFSHSSTRERMAFKTNEDIIVFISQDVIMKDENWLKNLVNPIIIGECDASFSRQICQNLSIEKYIREKNYPKESRVVSKDDIKSLGLITFFYSDASSAVTASVYKKLNGYDGKDLIINEDMYLAHKLVTNGYKIKYCSDSEVYHSHTFTLKQLFNRYFDTGVFFKQNSVFLEYNGNQSGVNLLKYVLKRSFQELNIKVIINVVPNFASRFIGSYLGERYEKLSLNRRIKYSLNKQYWTKIRGDV